MNVGNCEVDFRLTRQLGAIAITSYNPTYRYKSDQVSSNLVQLANFWVADNPLAKGPTLIVRSLQLFGRP